MRWRARAWAWAWVWCWGQSRRAGRRIRDASAGPGGAWARASLEHGGGAMTRCACNSSGKRGVRRGSRGAGTVGTGAGADADSADGRAATMQTAVAEKRRRDRDVAARCVLNRRFCRSSWSSQRGAWSLFKCVFDPRPRVLEPWQVHHAHPPPTSVHQTKGPSCAKAAP